jgi:hypothetical protein
MSQPDESPGRNIHIISYASRAFSNRVRILNAMLGKLPGITYKVYTESDIPQDFIDKVGPEVWNATKGAGFMCWKPWIINDYLARINDGDNLIYIDAGCTINLTNGPARGKLMEYLQRVNNPANCGMLRYELPQYKECDYTNRYFWDYMVSRYPSIATTDYYQTPQIMSAVMFMRKCPWVADLFTEAVSIILDNPVLLSEKYTQPGEIHRHDQSLLSVLYKMRGGDLVMPDNTYPRLLTPIERRTEPFLVTRLRR